MDNLGRSGEPKLGDADGTQLNNVAPTEEVRSQLVQESSETMPQIPTTESLLTRDKFKKKVSLIISVVILVLVLVSTGAWFVLSNKTGMNESVVGETSDSQNHEEEKPADTVTPKDEITELSVDDELVRRLRSNFRDNHIYAIDEVFSGKLSDALMMRFAAQNSVKAACKMSYYDAVEKRYAKYVADSPEEVWQIHTSGCYKGDDILFKVKDMFGIDITFTDGMQLIGGSFGPPYTYSIEYDEFFQEVFRAGGSGPGIVYATYAAEKTSNQVYIYDVAGYIYGTYDFNGENYELAGPVRPEKTCDFNVDGMHSLCRIDYTLNERTILEHLDNYTKFKWTFVWNEGNYVFEKLEQIQP